MFWYTRAPRANHLRERVLPNGCTQIILNLARNFLLDCVEQGPGRRTPPSIVVGARSMYEIVDTSDMADLIGVVFRPGSFPAFVSDAADRFSNQTVSLEDVCGGKAAALRERLCEISEPVSKLRCLESFVADQLGERLLQPRTTRDAAVTFALQQFARVPSITTVNEVARSTGWSERRFSQIFREEVGLTPKVWCRIQRFQRAVRQLHAGIEVPWSSLALSCGYYDQSHFANEFRAFSGVDLTTYSAHRTVWANHIAADSD